MVNMFWVKQCRVAKQLYEAKKTFLFHPIPHKLPIAGFSSVCILITGFGDGVRLAIVHTMKALGGTCVSSLFYSVHFNALKRRRWPGARFRLFYSCISTSCGIQTYSTRAGQSSGCGLLTASASESSEKCSFDCSPRCRCLETVATDQWSHVTHLVCDDSEGTKKGTKYGLCRRKKIPIVGLKWLGACVTSGKVQPHDAYAIKPQSGSCTQTQPVSDKVGPSQRVFAGTQGGFGMIGIASLPLSFDLMLPSSCSILPFS